MSRKCVVTCESPKMWKSFSQITRRLSLFSPRVSSSSRPPSPYVVRRYHCIPSIDDLPRFRFPGRPEEESGDVSVCVWWSSDRCKLPDGFDIIELAPTLTAALTATGIKPKGPIRINGFGNIELLSKANRDNLGSTGIHFEHVPNLKKRADADVAIYLSAYKFVIDNSAPAHLFFIFGTTLFGRYLHQLRMLNYNILVASNGSPVELTSSATFIWDWRTLIRGRKLIGHHTNYPPDGFPVSWYGHSDLPIVDPFSDPIPDRTAPKTVLKQIQRVLKDHPEGFCLDHLRLVLGFVNEKYYAEQKISEVILSFPEVLRVETSDYGETVVRSVSQSRMQM